jgi:hypothetical protein
LRARILRARPRLLWRAARGRVFRDVVKQAFRARVPGIILSREYTEMKPNNVSGVGNALRDLGLKI